MSKRLLGLPPRPRLEHPGPSPHHASPAGFVVAVEAVPADWRSVVWLDPSEPSRRLSFAQAICCPLTQSRTIPEISVAGARVSAFGGGKRPNLARYFIATQPGRRFFPARHCSSQYAFNSRYHCRRCCDGDISAHSSGVMAHPHTENP